MEVTSSLGRITKYFQIKDFSNYSTSSEIHYVTNVNIDNFRSTWEIKIFPMQMDESNINNPINCNVLIHIVCINSNSPLRYIKNIQVISEIKGRENYPIEIKLCKDSIIPTWKDILIPRAVMSAGILIYDIFNFSLEFIIKNEVLKMSENGSEQVAENLKILLDNLEYCDSCIIDSSGSKFLVHAAILQSRSNLLKNIISSDNLKMSTKNELISSTDFIVQKDENYMTNIYSNLPSDIKDSINIDRSPFKKRKTCTIALESTKGNKQNISSPRSSKVNKIMTPKKAILGSIKCESPFKNSQTQLTSYFPRSSSLKDDINHSSYIKQISNISPITTLKDISYSPQRKNKTIKEYLSPINPDRTFRSPSISQSPQRTYRSPQTPKRKLFSEGDENSKKLIINVNMSSSLVKEVLCWIYTGKSSRLSELAKPLMVAALRHKIPGLARAAQVELSSVLSVENACELLLLSHKYDATILKRYAMDFCIEHASEITKLTSWAELSFKYSDLIVEFTKGLADKNVHN